MGANLAAVLCCRSSAQVRPVLPPTPEAVAIPTLRGDIELVAHRTVTLAVDDACRRVDADPNATIGIDIGEVDFDLPPPGGTGTGPAAEAIALCDRGGAGSILLSSLAGRLLTDHHDLALEPSDAGPGAVELVVPRARLRGPGRHPVPLVLAQELSGTSVTRPEETARLSRAWEATVSGSALNVVLLEGEAGAGKTHLLARFARHSAEAGGLVLYGAAPEKPSISFQPWVEALRPLLAGSLPGAAGGRLPPEVLSDLDLVVGRAAASVEIEQQGDRMPMILGEPAANAARYWAFEAVVDLLAAVADDAPIALLLDDLHWASRPSLRLVEHVTRSPRVGPLCLVLAHRDSPADRTPAFIDTLGELVRRPGLSRIGLTGFDRSGVTAFVLGELGLDRSTGPVDRIVDQLLDQTDGNPFLLTQAWRQLVETGRVSVGGGLRGVEVAGLDGVATPRSVRDALARRLGQLRPDSRRVLELAACLGTRIDAATVAAAAGEGMESTLAHLTGAVAAGLVVPVDRSTFRFAHALTRQAIEDTLSPASRARCHLALARALAADGRIPYTVLTHHFAAAVPLEPPSTAVGYARLAAARFLQSVSYDDAVAVLDTALAVVDDDEARADLLVDRSAAAALSGSGREAARASLEAAAIARRLDDHPRLLAAARAMAEATWRGTLHGGPAVDLLNEALAGETDDSTRTALLGGLSAALALSGRDDESGAVGREAVALARRVGDPRGLVEAIHNAGYASMAPGTVRAQLALAREGGDLARGLGDELLELRLVCKAILRLLVVVDPPLLAELRTRLDHLADTLRQPYFLLVRAGIDVTVSLADGRLDDAEAAVQDYQRWVTVQGETDTGYGIQMFSLRREQGRLTELRPVLELGARLNRDDQSWAPGLAAVYAEIGMIDEARSILDRLASDDFGSIAQDSLLPGVLSYLADAAVACDHHTAAEAVHALLTPYSGLLVYIPGLVGYGAADRYLGRLCRMLGRNGDAARHLEAALALDERTGWAGTIAHSRLALGELLVSRRRAGDRGRGAELLRLAHSTAAACGMRPAADRAARALAGAPAPRRGELAPTVLTRREVEVLRLIAQGLSNKEAGAALHASPHTIANHVRAILQKTATANRTEAAAWAFRAGLVGPAADTSTP